MGNRQRNSSPFFKSGWDGMLPKIIAVSIAFHLAIVVGLVVLNKINFEHRQEPVKIFDLVQLPQQIAPKAHAAHRKPRTAKPKPDVKKEVKKREVKPVTKPELPPEPKIAKEEPKREPEPQPEPEEPVEEEPMDLPDDMSLPDEIAEESGLNPVGYVDMDPLMQVYLERLKQIIMQQFNPPSGLNVAKSTKTTVQFTVDRFGKITNISLRRSSGNKTWDHLSMRAIQISHLPELPPNYRAPALSLNFNFTPN